MVRPTDETVMVWNDDVINIAQLLKRAANEVLKSASGRNVSGLETPDKATFKGQLKMICSRIENMAEGYFPATHNDVTYLAILADYTHPEIVTATPVAKPHEPGE